MDPLTQNVLVRRWETHLTPRKLTFENDQTGCMDTFGYNDGIEKIDRGWLTTETLIQFKFFNNPFNLKQKMKNRLLLVKVSVSVFNCSCMCRRNDYLKSK